MPVKFFTPEVFASGAVGFILGIVKAVLFPERRGVAGFLSAVVVGACCGLVAGLLAKEWGCTTATQFSFAAAFGIAGDRFIFAIMAGHTTNVTNIDSQNGNVIFSDDINVTDQSVGGNVQGNANFIEGDQTNVRGEEHIDRG